MKKHLIIILFLPLILCGCQSEQEINNLAIVNAVGISKNKENKFEVSIQVLNTRKDQESDQENIEKSLTYTSSGNNISEALDKITIKSPKSIYLGHLELVMISEKLAKEGIKQISDYFLRNSKVSKNFTLLVSKEEPIEILKSIEGNVTYPIGNILGSIEISSDINGTSTNTKFTKFMSDLLIEGKNPVLPTVTLEKDKPIINNIAVFDKKKLLGYLNNEENIGYNFITDNIKNTNINYKCDKNNFVGVSITDSKTKMVSKIINEKPIIYLNVDTNATITEVNCPNGIDDFEKVRKEIQNKIKYLIDNVIKKTKEDFNSDIFGFGKHLYQNNYFYWNNNKDNWYKGGYRKQNIKYKIDVKLDNQGSILGTVR